MIKLSPKMKTLFSSDSRYYILTGGRGATKSFSVTTFLAILMLIESGHTILFTRYTMTSANISIIPEFVNKLEMMGILDKFEITKTSIICKMTKSKVIFKGIRTSSGDQTASLKSLQGVTTWVLDEAEELIDEDIFNKINLSIRHKTKQNRVILILNPTTKAHWIYRRFYIDNNVDEGVCLEKNGITYIHTTYLDNIKNLDETFLNEVKYMEKSNPDKYKHIVMGGWLDMAEGVIFNNWEIGDFMIYDKIYYGADWGFSVDPSTLVEVSINKKEKIIYCRERFYKPLITTTYLIREYKNICGNNLIIADNGGGGDRIVADMISAGLNIKKATKGPGSVKDGIVLLQDYKIIVDKDSKNLITELRNYRWKNDEPMDLYNHLLDALRYVISYVIKSGSPMFLY